MLWGKEKVQRAFLFFWNSVFLFLKCTYHLYKNKNLITLSFVLERIFEWIWKSKVIPTLDLPIALIAQMTYTTVSIVLLLPKACGTVVERWINWYGEKWMQTLWMLWTSLECSRVSCGLEYFPTSLWELLAIGKTSGKRLQ